MLTTSVQPLVRSTRAMIWTAIAGMTFVLAPSVCQAGFTVAAGYDFFGAIKGTSFYGQQFQGVSPYGYNFGWVNGRYVGFKYMGKSNTSMIVRRLGPASLSGPGTATVGVQLGYFMLRSTSKINLFGQGKDFYYVTLNTGKASKGMYSIHFNSNGSGGTFDAKITLNYVVRKGGANGRIVKWVTTTLTMHDSWSRTPDHRIGVVTYANWLLNGRNNMADFFALGLQNWSGSNGGSFTSQVASPFRVN